MQIEYMSPDELLEFYNSNEHTHVIGHQEICQFSEPDADGWFYAIWVEYGQACYGVYHTSQLWANIQEVLNNQPQPEEEITE